MIRTWIFYVVYALDLLGNAILAGSPHETVSSRCYRLNHIPFYAALERVINTLAYPFDGPNHCRSSYENIANGTYLPWEFFEKAEGEAKEMDLAIWK